MRTFPRTAPAVAENILAIAQHTEARRSAACPGLSPDDQQLLARATGLLEEKQHVDVQCTLDKISPGARMHPEVLQAHMELQAGLKNHSRTVELGRLLVRDGKCLDRASVWLTLADSLHQLGRTREAYDTLKQFARHEWRNGAVFYKLAVYACLLGRPADAKRHFTRAMNTPEGAKLKIAALEDAHLRDIWDFLCA